MLRESACGRFHDARGRPGRRDASRLGCRGAADVIRPSQGVHPRVVEGLTEFLPVSSTGHLLLVQRFFGFDDDDFGKTFAVLIQFGAILALLSIYFVRLWRLALGFFNDPAARRFVIGVLIAFLPAAVVGALAHDFIKRCCSTCGSCASR